MLVLRASSVYFSVRDLSLSLPSLLLYAKAWGPAHPLAENILPPNSTAAWPTRLHTSPAVSPFDQPFCAAESPPGPRDSLTSTASSWGSGSGGWIVETLLGYSDIPTLTFGALRVYLSIGMCLCFVRRTAHRLHLFLQNVDTAHGLATVAGLFCWGIFWIHVEMIGDRLFGRSELNLTSALGIPLFVLRAAHLSLDLFVHKLDFLYGQSLESLIAHMLHPLPQDEGQRPAWRHRERARG